MMAGTMVTVAGTAVGPVGTAGSVVASARGVVGTGASEGDELPPRQKIRARVIQVEHPV